ncbi:MAG: response regulator transcription factor [Scrofimicrobium sp.]
MKLAVAEDDVLMRQGIVSVLELGGHEVIWEVGDAHALARSLKHELPTMLLTDVRMPPNHGDDGLRTALALRSTHPETSILVLSQYAGSDYARKLLQGAGNAQGGTGYLLKEGVGRVSQFLATVDAVGRGEVVIDPRVIRHLTAQDNQPASRLTSREKEVLSLIAQGRTNAQIADEIYVSPATLERTISNIFLTLDLAETNGNRRVLAVLEYLKQAN